MKLKEPKLKEVESMGDFIENALKILEFTEKVHNSVRGVSGLHGYLAGGLAMARYSERQKRGV